MNLIKGAISGKIAIDRRIPTKGITQNILKLVMLPSKWGA